MEKALSSKSDHPTQTCVFGKYNKSNAQRKMRRYHYTKVLLVGFKKHLMVKLGVPHFLCVFCVCFPRRAMSQGKKGEKREEDGC